MVGLGFLPDCYASYGGAVTPDGAVTVGGSWYGGSELNWEATRWTWGGSAIGFGDLAGGEFYSMALDVSDDGNVIVGESRSEQYPDCEAFRWTPGGGIVGLGALPGASRSSALAVSANGSIVVGSCQPTGAFYWSEGTGMVSLRDLLEDTYGLDLTGWTLGGANGISADGTTIVGNGAYEGDPQGWVAKIEQVQVTVVRPDGGEIFKAGTQDTIRWIATVEGDGLLKAQTGVTSVDISYSLDGGISFPYPIATGIGNSGIFFWTIPSTLSSNCKVKVVAHSGGLQGNDVSDGTFTIATTQVPTISPLGALALFVILGFAAAVSLRGGLRSRVV
jgi:probable HAF family extracellular repeat protein